jgi:hypothetical protein
MKTIIFTTIGVFISKIIYKWEDITSRQFIQVQMLDNKLMWLNTSFIMYIQEMEEEEFKKFQPLLNRKIEVPDLGMKGRFN